MAPGATSNFLVLFSNQSDSVKEFTLKLRPAEHNWKQFMNYPPIRIQSNSSVNKIISITVPEKTRDGDYTVTWEVFEEPQNQQAGSINIPIRVLPKYDLSIEKQNTPGYLISGDSARVEYRIYNLSNSDIEVETKIINGSKMENKSFKIPQDSFVNTGTLVTAAKNTETYMQQSVTLTAQMKEKPEIYRQQTYRFDIIPAEHTNFDKYNRFPINISSLMATGKRFNKSYYALLFDVNGSGSISEDGNNKLTFRFRGPDRRGNPILGLNDEYYMTYQTKSAQLFLGDHNYSLSSLTESSRMGRGVRAQYNLRDISVGAFYHVPRYYPEIKNAVSVYANFNINDKLQLFSGYLAKTDTLNKTANLITLSGNVRPVSWLSSSFEVAVGLHEKQFGKAGMGSLNLSTKYLSSHVNIKYADQFFPGYISNSLMISSGVKASLNKFSLSANYDRNNANLALDTLYANAPNSENLNLIAFLRLNPKNSIGLSANSILLEDKGQYHLFHYKKYFGRIFMDTRISNFSLNMYGDYGKIHNLLEVNSNQANVIYSGHMQVKYALNKTFAYSGFIKYQGGKQQQITGSDKFYYGSSIQINLKKTFFIFDFQSDYEFKDYYMDRSLLSMQLHYQFNPHHTVDVSANYNLVKNSLYNKDLNIQIRYAYNLHLPVSKKKTIGSLKGKVISKNSERVDGIMVKLNGQKSITNKNGYFSYPALKSGAYTLTLDDTNFEINTTTAIPGPYKIEIEPGKETQFVAELTKTAKIKGKMTIKEDKNEGYGFYKITEEIQKLIVEASDGTEVYRVFTDSEGICQFNDLRPGKWKIRIFKNGIPSGYQLVKDYFQIELEPNEEHEFVIEIEKKNKEIKFQSGF